jgi:hypothetical protein
MPLPWKQQPINVLTDWIMTIREELSDELSSWEINFIDSIEGQLTSKGYLSERQEEILERIYSRTP